jgi:hypothetical protein
MTRPRLVAFAGAVVAVAGAGAVVATALPERGDGGDPMRAKTGRPPVAAVDERLPRSYAVMRRDRNGRDDLPAAAAAALERGGAQGVNVRLARRSAERGSATVYVVPGEDALCAAMVDETGTSLGCEESPARAAETGVSPTTERTTRGVRIFGLVPDGVDSVRVWSRGSDDSRVVAVAGNGYVTEVGLAFEPAAVTYEGPAGWETFPIEYVRGPVEPIE